MPNRDYRKTGAITLSQPLAKRKALPKGTQTPHGQLRGAPSFNHGQVSQDFATNPIERLHADIKRCTYVVAIYPNEDAITRLVGAVLLEPNDEWAVSRRYITLESIAPVSDNPTVKLPGAEPERPGPNRRMSRRTPGSYTTSWDMIAYQPTRSSK